MSRKHYKKGRYAFAVSAAGSATALSGGTGVSGGAVLNTKLSSAEQFDRVVAVTEPITPTVQPSTNVGNTTLPEPVGVKEPNLGVQPVNPPVEKIEPMPVSTDPQTPEPVESKNGSGNQKKWILLAVAAGVLFLFLRKK